MADAQSNIKVSIDTTDALTSIKNLQRQISAFHTSMAKSGAAANAVTSQMQQNLVNSINATGKFAAQMQTIKTTTESFTDSLQKNKFSLGEYFRYAGGASKSFGKLFKTEFDTINKVARENVKDLQTQYIKMGRDANGAMKAISVRPLSLDMNDLATKTMIASERQALLNQLLKQGSTNLLNFGKNTQWAGRQLMVGFTIPLLTLGSAASKTFMDMETQAIRFKKVYGDLFTPKDETAKALQDIQDLGKEFTKYGIAVSSTVGLASEAAAAGFKGLDLQRQTTAATKLSILGQVDSQKALETTISLQNAFSMSSADLATNIDFLNAVENQTVLSLDDMSTAIPKAAPIIQQLGGDVKDLAFFMTAMKEGGINASEGANAIKSGLASLINPTGKASAMLAGFGINVKKIVVDNKGDLKKTVIDFATALNQLDPLNRAQAIEQMFGKFQFARLSTLFSNVTKEGTQAARVLDLAGSSVQDLAALSEKELGMTSESAMNKFKASIENLKLALVPVGEQFLKAVTPIAEFVTKILDGFNNLGDGTKKVIVTLTAIVAGLGPVLLMTFGLLANGLANIIKGFTAIKTIFNKTGQSSATLGTEVKYMTLEQRNAAAVAASLDQVHNNLAQTFTSEAASVDRLTAAYQRSIAAQRQFAGPVLPRSKTPKKFAKGKPYTVGGTGNKDSELSYLMPGETVIPTKESSKYGNLINAIISDSVPGYSTGKKSLSDLKKDNKLYAAPNAVADQTSKMTWNTLKDELAAVDQVAKDFNGTLKDENKLSVEQIANMKRVTAAHKTEDTVNVPMGDGNSMSVKAWKAKNLMPEIGPNTFLNTLVSKKEGLSAFEGQGMAQAAQKLGISMTDVSKELDLLKKGIQPTTKQGASVLQEVAGFYKDERPTTTRTGKPKKESSSARGVRFQAAATEAVLKTRLADTSGGQYYDTMVTGAYDASKDTKAAEQVYAKARKVRMAFLQETEAMADKAMTAIKQRLGIKSPSTELITVGEQMAEGMAIGIKNGNAEVVAASKNLGKSAVDATDRVVKEKNRRVSTRPQGPAPIGLEAPAGATMLNLVAPLTPEEAKRDRRQKTKTRILDKTKAVGSKLGTRLGGGTALLGANMALSAVPDFAGKDVIQSTMTGANMGMLFGPWGAAAGAAVGLVSSALGKLIEKEKQQKAMAEATFKSSADLATFFGNAVVETELRVGSFTASLGVVGTASDNLGKSFGYTNAELKSFVDLIASLPENNPLKDIVDGLANEKNPANINKIAQAFITTQVALGQIKPEQAQKTLDLMLSASGHADMVGASFMNLKTQSEAVSLSLKNASVNSVALGTSLTQLVGAASNATSLGQLTMMLDGIAASGISAASALSSMYYAYLQVGNIEGAKAAQVLKRVAGITAEQSTSILVAVTKGFDKTVTAQTDAKKLAAEAEAFLKDPKLWKAQNTGQSTKAYQGEKQVGSLKAEIKILKAKKKIIDDQLKKEQQISDELKRQNDYRQKQAQIDAQIVEAKIRGNYIEAANLMQQKKNNTAQYNQEGKTSALQAQADALQAKIDKLQESSDATVSAINGTTSAVATGAAAVVAAIGALNFQGPTGASKSQAISVPTDSASIKSYFDTNKPTKAVSTRGGAAQVRLAESDIDAAKAWTDPQYRDRFEAYVRANLKPQLDAITDPEQGIVISAVGSDKKTYKYNVKKNGDFIRIAETKGKAMGGLIRKYASGGLIKGPGTGTSDSITASLGYAGGGGISVSNGEFVVKASSVKDYGLGNMNAINNGTATIGTNSGGTVYNINMPITSNASDPKVVGDYVIKQLKLVVDKNNKGNSVKM